MTSPTAPDNLPDLLGGRYRITREIGHGGMARVYLAHDIKHARDVAVKVIRAELAASLGRERFLREIAIAARLRHPNIVPLFDSGDADHVLYFVMPYEDGPSLRKRLDADGALPIADAMSVLRDVARALQYAHAQGVVHRDIKPDNVMLSSGTAVVTDFGIAKAVSAAQAETTGNTITQTGAGIGTPAYMAPEQAVGDPSSDHRADIYSFGCVAYELLTGQPPFHGLPAFQLVASHVSIVPKPVTDVRPEISPALSQLIAACLEKDPAARPQSATDLISRLDAPSDAAVASAAPRTRHASRWLPAAAVTVVLLGAIGYFVLNRGAALPAEEITMSVLPITNIGADSSLSPFASGLREDVFSALQRVHGLQMRSRAGARAFGGRLGIDVKAVAKRLNVQYLVTGEMREEAGRWRITATLTRAADETELWTQPFLADSQQQLGIAEQIASAVTTKLREISPRSLGVLPTRAPNQQTTNTEAYRQNLLAQEQLLRRVRVTEDVELFRQAIRLDPSYASAWAGLSMAHVISPFFGGPSHAVVYDSVLAAASQALRRDSTLSQPRVARGLAYELNFEWDKAETEYRAALRWSSTDAEARLMYGRGLLFRGLTEDAIQQLQVARLQDPASPTVLHWLAYGYYLLGRQDIALVLSGQSLEAQVTGPGIKTRLRILARNGDRDSTLALARAQGDPHRGLNELAAFGDTATAWMRMRAIEKRGTDESRFSSLAMLYLGLADTAAALGALEHATDAREIWPMSFAVTDPIYDPVRSSPRFLALMPRIGLSPEVARITARARSSPAPSPGPRR
jgi:eukaryotic-like serine/threonine-protein kinase